MKANEGYYPSSGNSPSGPPRLWGEPIPDSGSSEAIDILLREDRLKVQEKQQDVRKDHPK